MYRNTNTVFLIICGGIIILAVYLIIATDAPRILSGIFSNNQETIEKTDDGMTPTKSSFIKIKKENDNTIIYFTKTNNTSRYKCIYGSEKGKMNNDAIVHIGRENIECKINKTINTDYYVQLISINNRIEIKSDIQKVLAE